MKSDLGEACKQILTNLSMHVHRSDNCVELCVYMNLDTTWKSEHTDLYTALELCAFGAVKKYVHTAK